MPNFTQGSPNLSDSSVLQCRTHIYTLNSWDQNFVFQGTSLWLSSVLFVQVWPADPLFTWQSASNSGVSGALIGVIWRRSGVPAHRKYLPGTDYVQPVGGVHLFPWGILWLWGWGGGIVGLPILQRFSQWRRQGITVRGEVLFEKASVLLHCSFTSPLFVYDYFIVYNYI